MHSDDFTFSGKNLNAMNVMALGNAYKTFQMRKQKRKYAIFVKAKKTQKEKKSF